MQSNRNKIKAVCSKNAWTALLISILPFSSCSAQPDRFKAVADFFVGRPAPDFKLKDLDGREMQLSLFKGSVVLLDFWATWCGPCRAEIPMIEDISKKLGKKNVIVIGIDSEEPEEVVRKFVTKNKITYPILLTADNPTVVRTYAAHALPTAVIVDKDGIIAAYHIGENFDTERKLRDDITHVSSSKYVAPKPKAVQLAQDPMPQPPAPPISTPNGPDPNWQPKTADEFVASSYVQLRNHKYSESRSAAEKALKLNPECFIASYLLGRIAYEERNYSTAIDILNETIRENPKWAEAYHYRGLSNSYSGRHQEALPDYQKLIELSPYLAAAYNDAGWAYTELSQFDKAKASLDKAIEIEPDYLRARKNRAILFSRESDWANEMTELKIVRALAPSDQWAQEAEETAIQKRSLPSMEQSQTMPNTTRPDVFPKIVSKIEPEYTEEAKRAFVNSRILCSLVINPEGVPQNVHVTRGAGFGLDENAIRAVSTWRFEPAMRQGVAVPYTANVEVSFRLLMAEHELQIARLNFTIPAGGNRPELVRGKVPENPKDSTDSELRIALSVDADGIPKDLSILETTSSEWADSAIREIKHWRFRPGTVNGQTQEVKGVLELVRTSNGSATGPLDLAWNGTGTSMRPDPKWEPRTPDEFLARGSARLRSQKNPQAEADAEDALKLCPDAPAAWFLHGRAAYALKDYSTAIADFDKVIRQKPDWSTAYRFRGLALSYSGQQERALSDFEKAIELAPDVPAAYNALGWAYTELGKFELARTNLDKAIALDPSVMLARENRAKLFAKQGDGTAELNELNIILGLFPNNKWAKDMKDAMLQRSASLHQ